MENIISAAKEYVEQGRVLYSEGNYEKALDYFKKAESEDAMNPDVYINEGQTYVMLDRYDDAKEAFSKVLNFCLITLMAGVNTMLKL